MFKVGERVAIDDRPDCVGTVLAFTSIGGVVVEWENHSAHDCNFDNLIPVNVAVERLAQFNAEKSRLEQEFEKAKHDMKVQLDAAANYVLLHDPLIDVSGFERVVERSGWSTSSLYC